MCSPGMVIIVVIIVVVIVVRRTVTREHWRTRLNHLVSCGLVDHLVSRLLLDHLVNWRLLEHLVCFRLLHHRPLHALTRRTHGRRIRVEEGRICGRWWRRGWVGRVVVTVLVAAIVLWHLPHDELA
jgi:hypothetical protein